MRYFFPLELELFLDRAGFSLLELGGVSRFDAEPDPPPGTSSLLRAPA